jgi:hypothetical protein
MKYKNVVDYGKVLQEAKEDSVLVNMNRKPLVALYGHVRGRRK